MKCIANYLIETESLGKGQFGQVFSGYDKDNHSKRYAVKVVKKSTLTNRLQQNLKNEISIMFKVNSPNVIKLYDLQRTENNFYLIMELCNGGDLEHLKELRKGRFKELEARIMIQQLVSGFQAIYSQQVMHRDLKLANLLVHFPEYPYNLVSLREGAAPKEKKAAVEEFLKNVDLTVKGRIVVKIADLGFARHLEYDDLSDTICGTPLVMAPEVLNGKRYNHKADVWSLGVIFFEMIAGFTPFTGKDKQDLKNNLEKGQYAVPKSIKLSLQGLDFLNSCLQFDSNKRLSWSELVNHPYIKNDPHEELQSAMGKSTAEVIRLSYSEIDGSFIDQNVLADGKGAHARLNPQNAIMLNVKDQAQYQRAYEEAIERHFKKQIRNPEPVLVINQEHQSQMVGVEDNNGNVDASIGFFEKLEILNQVEEVAIENPDQEEAKLPAAQIRSPSPVKQLQPIIEEPLVLDTKSKIPKAKDDIDSIAKQINDIINQKAPEPKVILRPEREMKQIEKQHQERKEEEPYFNYEDVANKPEQPKPVIAGGPESDYNDLAYDSFYYEKQRKDQAVVVPRDPERWEENSTMQEQRQELVLDNASLKVKENYFI